MTARPVPPVHQLPLFSARQANSLASCPVREREEKKLVDLRPLSNSWKKGKINPLRNGDTRAASEEYLRKVESNLWAGIDP